MMTLLRRILSLLPASLQENVLGAYHLSLSYLGAAWYGNPSRKLVVIGVTGTKGKSSTAELIRTILTESGRKTAIVGTIRFAIGDTEERNLFKMTMPGRFFIQSFLARAAKAGCTHAVIEMTSEGALQHRHRGIEMNALVFTNLSPEHIERHGSFENYASAKLSIAEHLMRSPKRPRIMVANADDAYGEKFLAFPAEIKHPYTLKSATIEAQSTEGSSFVYKDARFTLHVPGLFNISNALAAIEVCDALGISPEEISAALSKLTRIPGRAERILQGQPFEVVVDYAHTPDSLTAIYEAFTPSLGGRRICVLGNTGGGRDTWKRPVMGEIADTYCDVAILTDEDSYDERLEDILAAMKQGFKKHEPRVIVDRREAIRAALVEAKTGDAILITGKGTDPYIMGPRGSKQPWSDKRVAEEELAKLLER
jgi:UDP-N-acetylmuramoyl-L-alanyl-D-glutamate--2,6-diaminopimelate ligase